MCFLSKVVSGACFMFFPWENNECLMVWNRRAPLETSLKISGSTDSTRSGRSCPDRHMVARCSRSTTFMWQVAGGGDLRKHLESENLAGF